MSNIEFESERLIYRKFNEHDFPALLKLHSDIENMRYRRDGVKNEAETRKYMEWVISEANAKERKEFWLAAVRKTDNVLIGEAILRNIHETPELGWLVDKNHCRQGYGTEIGNSLLKYGFERLKSHRIISACFTDNHSSYRLMEKLGMRREAHFIKSVLRGNEWCDRFQYAILRDEWRK